MSNYKNPFEPGGKFYNPRITDGSKVTEPRIMPRWTEQNLTSTAEPIDNENNIILLGTNKTHKIKREILPQQYQNILSQVEYDVFNNTDYTEYIVYFTYETLIYELFISRKNSIDIYRVFEAYLSIDVEEEITTQIPGSDETVTRTQIKTIHTRDFPITDNLMFNCHGYTFLNGNFWIGNLQAEAILQTNYKNENDLLKAEILALYFLDKDKQRHIPHHTAKVSNGSFSQKKGGYRRN